MTIQQKVDLLTKYAVGIILLIAVAYALIWWVYEQIKQHPMQSYFDELERARRDNFYYRVKERIAERKVGLEPPMPWPTPGPMTAAKFQIGQPVMVDNKQGMLLELTILSRSYYPPKSMWMYSFEGTTTNYGEDLIQVSPNYIETFGRYGDRWVAKQGSCL